MLSDKTVEVGFRDEEGILRVQREFLTQEIPQM